jgi:hypothetical protein
MEKLVQIENIFMNLEMMTTAEVLENEETKGGLVINIGFSDGETQFTGREAEKVIKYLESKAHKIY